MRKWLNKYFDFTKSEFNGLLVLIVLIAVVTAAPYAYALVGNEYKEEDDLVLKRLIFKNDREVSPKSFADKTYKTYKTKREYFARNPKHSARNNVNLFYFDPNLIGQADWMRLGLSEKQAAAVVRYVEKGGQFRQVGDLKKMYTISPEKYLELSPYVKITNPSAGKYPAGLPINSSKTTNSDQPIVGNTPVRTEGPSKAIFNSSYPKNAVVVVEINGADSASLDGIRGIGPAFALRILTYRERIGGFVNKEQLMEVFGLDSLKYSEIKSQVRVDANSIRKININTVTTDKLKNHPYIRFKQLNAIVQYRIQHGNYGNIADLAKVVVIPAETITRLAPYLTF
jgi:competence protein ComEA